MVGSTVDLVRKFGDCTWIDHAIMDETDPLLFAAREDRDVKLWIKYLRT